MTVLNSEDDDAKAGDSDGLAEEPVHEEIDVNTQVSTAPVAAAAAAAAPLPLARSRRPALAAPVSPKPAAAPLLPFSLEAACSRSSRGPALTQAGKTRTPISSADARKEHQALIIQHAAGTLYVFFFLSFSFSRFGSEVCLVATRRAEATFKEQHAAADLMASVAAAIKNKAESERQAHSAQKNVLELMKTPMHISDAHIKAIHSADSFVDQLPLSEAARAMAKSDFVTQSVSIFPLSVQVEDVTGMHSYLTTTCHLTSNLAVHVVRLVLAMSKAKHTFLTADGREF